MTQKELADEFLVNASTVALWESAARTVPGPALRLMELFEEELGMTKPVPNDEAAPLSRLSTSRLQRGFVLSRTLAAGAAGLAGAALTGALSGEERASQLRVTAQAAVGRRLAESLGELKGVSMKLGQMLSYLDFAMAPAAREVLARLQSQSQPMTSEAVLTVFLEELGKAPQDLFAAWDPTPISAASIGQVHRARLHSGEAVAVKVQYPGIRDALLADLRNVALLDRLITILFPAQDKGAVSAELSERILEECDYRLEAERQAHFRALWSGRDGVYVPRVFPDLSTSRILVSELIDGKPFADFVAEADQAERNRAGELLFQVAWESILKHGIFNADPHPGNYLFRGGEVVLLDFGCVKTYQPAFIAGWKRLIRATLEDDREAIPEIVLELGLIKDPQHYNFDYHRQMMFSLHEPLLADSEFQFTPDYLHDSWRKIVTHNQNKFRMNMPRDWLFANRLQWGLYAVLSMLDARVNFRRRMLDLVYAPGEPRPAPLRSGGLT